MMYQSWVTFLSLLVSGTMLFTLAATLVLYTKYKLGNVVALPQPMVMKQKLSNTKEREVSAARSVSEAILTLQNSQAQIRNEIKPALKRKISLGNALESSES